MICYRDRTFCPPEICWECSKVWTCPRRTDSNVLENAEKLGLPICYYAETPDCFEPVKAVK